jgi:hypothetical protein
LAGFSSAWADAAGAIGRGSARLHDHYPVVLRRKVGDVHGKHSRSFLSNSTTFSPVR